MITRVSGVARVFDPHSPLLSNAIRGGLFSTARHLFDEIRQRQAYAYRERNPDSFNSAVVGFAKSGHFKEALALFHRLNGLNWRSDKYTLCAVVSSCSKLLAQQVGIQIHAQIIRLGLDENMFLSSALVDFYAKCGDVLNSKRVFDGMKQHDAVSWTSVISGFSQNRNGKVAVQIFKELIRSDVKPNCVTFVSVLSGCSGLESNIGEGASLHGQIIKRGIELNSFLLSALIAVYAKCGEISCARNLFCSSVHRDTIVCNSMMAGFSQNELGEEALKLFLKMLREGTTPSHFSFASALNASASLAIIQHGMQIHSLASKMGWNRNVYVSCALIDMYSKCGRVEEARKIFNSAVERNRVLWTAMLTGYANSGRGEEAVELFEEMVNEGMRPDHVCFSNVLMGCNHSGFLDGGLYYFSLMKNEYGLVPKIEQYACMIDLYGRNGHLVKARELMEEMEFEPNAVIWTSILGSCRLYGEVELGKEAALELFRLEPDSASPYLALACLYANAGMWTEANEIKRLMELRAARKRAGWSKVERDLALLEANKDCDGN